MVAARYSQGSRSDPGGDDHGIETGPRQGICGDPGAEPQFNPGIGDAVGEVAQGFVELLLARDALGHVELAADLAGLVEQGDRVAAFGQGGGGGQAGGSGADHRVATRLRAWLDQQLGLVAGARIDQAGRVSVLEDVVEAGLVAGDAGIDAICLAAACLVHPFGVGQQRTRHRDHVGVATGEDLLGHLRHVDPVGRDQRQRDLKLELGGDAGERGPRHRSDDGRNACLVPADAGVDQGRAGRLDGLGQGHDLVPALCIVDQVEHRQPVDDDEVAADRGARAANDLDRKAHAPFGAAAPVVAARVGARGDELVDQVAFRTHDLDAIVTGVLGELGAVDEIADGALDAAARQRARRERRDRRLDLRRADRQRVVGVATTMQDLHADAPAFGMRRGGDPAMPRDMPGHGQATVKRLQPAFDARRDAAGDHQGDTAAGTLGEIRGEPVEVARTFLESGMHRPHQHAIGQGREAEVERRKQVRVVHRAVRNSNERSRCLQVGPPASPGRPAPVPGREPTVRRRSAARSGSGRRCRSGRPDARTGPRAGSRAGSPDHPVPKPPALAAASLRTVPRCGCGLR